MRLVSTRDGQTNMRWIRKVSLCKEGGNKTDGICQRPDWVEKCCRSETIWHSSMEIRVQEGPTNVCAAWCRVLEVEQNENILLGDTWAGRFKSN